MRDREVLLKIENEERPPTFMEVRAGDTLVIVHDFPMNPAMTKERAEALRRTMPEGVTVLILDRVSQAFVVRGQA